MAEANEDHGANEKYEGGDFVYKEGNKLINLVLQWLLLAPRQEEVQRHKIFQSFCTVNNKVCNLIINGGSCENLTSKKVLDYLKLPTEKHESPYSLRWVKRGPSIQVTEVCKIPLSIGKHCKFEVLCDIIDIDANHISLGRPRQFDTDASYKGRDNVYFSIKALIKLLWLP